MKKISIFAFLLAVFVVMASALIETWSSSEQQKVAAEATSLETKTEQAATEIKDLNEKLEKPIVKMMKLKSAVPEVTCDRSGIIARCETKKKFVTIEVPQVVGTEIDPGVAMRISQIQEQLSSYHHKANELEAKGEKASAIGTTFKDYIRGLLSIIVIFTALFIIIRNSSNDESQKWAFGAVGTILGYWFGV
jgi:large-conductance mechanosensitive channel